MNLSIISKKITQGQMVLTYVESSAAGLYIRPGIKKTPKG